MTDQHRATPEQWAKCEEDARLWSGALNCILELRSRIEALEAAQLEQAESHRFCVDAIVRRVEALEAAQQDKLDWLIALNRVGTDLYWDQANGRLVASAKTQVETTYGSEAAADAAQILHAPMVVQGTFEHSGETYRFKANPEREAPMTELRPASPEAQPGGLVERVAARIEYGIDANQDPGGIARAVIREQAAWLRDRYPKSPEAGAVAFNLCQEAME